MDGVVKPVLDLDGDASEGDCSFWWNYLVDSALIGGVSALATGRAVQEK